jgi:hypothetical protein
MRSAFHQTLHHETLLHHRRSFISNSARRIQRDNLAPRLRPTLTSHDNEGRQRRLNFQALLAGHYSPPFLFVSYSPFC